jgi:hypothetical protein
VLEHAEKLPHALRVTMGGGLDDDTQAERSVFYLALADKGARDRWVLTLSTDTLN